WTRMAGTLQSVVGTTVPATATVTVIRDRLNAPFSLGQSITLAVGASTAVVSPTATGTVVLTGTAALPTLAAATGKTLTVLGTYDRAHLSFTTVYRVFIHRK